MAGSGVVVILAGGALAENIFWQESGLIDVGSGTHLEGIFLVKTSMAFRAALAQTAITLIGTEIEKASSSASRMVRVGV